MPVREFSAAEVGLNWEFPNLVVSNLVVAIFVALLRAFLRPFALLHLRSFALLHLRSFALICVLLHLTTSRTTAFGSFRSNILRDALRQFSYDLSF